MHNYTIHDPAFPVKMQTGKEYMGLTKLQYLTAVIASGIISANYASNQVDYLAAKVAIDARKIAEEILTHS